MRTHSLTSIIERTRTGETDPCHSNSCPTAETLLKPYLFRDPRNRRFSSKLLKMNGAQGRDRTTDTVIFSHVLYQLSYLGTALAYRKDRPRSPAKALVFRLFRRAFGHFVVFVRQWRGRDGIAAREPSPEIHVGAATRAKRSVAFFRRPAADRTFAEFGHRLILQRSHNAREASRVRARRSPRGRSIAPARRGAARRGMRRPPLRPRRAPGPAAARPRA